MAETKQPAETKTKILRIPAALIAEAYRAGQHVVDNEGATFAAVEVIETQGRGSEPNTIGIEILAALGEDDVGIEERYGRKRCLPGAKSMKVVA